MHLPRRTLFLGFAVFSSLSLAVACGSDDSTSGDGGGGEAGSGETGGSGGEGDTGGSGGSTGGSSGSAGSATGGTTGDGGAGMGGEGGSGPVDCSDAEALPDGIDVDTTVGPGCVRIDRTYITDGAVLTIAPGTTVVMAAAGFLSAGYNGDNSALVSIGTAANPITFTSEAENPLPGDWECVSIFGESSASEIRYTTFEYGGAPCSTTGADYEGMLQIDAAARAVSNATFRSSSTHGVLILSDGGVREFENNSFSDNEGPSINIAAPQLIALGTGLDFVDDDDFIAVDATFSLAETGTLLGQPVPFRIPSGFSLGSGAEVTVGAGARLEFMGGSMDVFNSNLIVAGTEADPVVFTSSQANPMPGDWGCITFSSVTGTPRFDHAVVEYAGNGQGCTGANYETALHLPQSAVVVSSTFRNIAGSAITASDCNVPDWCENTFENVEVGPLACDTGQMPTACP